MKKIRVNLKRNKKKWSFVLFDSSESAFYLKDEQLAEDVADYYRIVTLSPSDVMEIEWLGSEYIYEDEYNPDPSKKIGSKHEKFDKIRLAKFLPVKTKVHSTGYVELHSGWIAGDTFNWSAPCSKGDVKITEINSGSIGNMDFESLFKGRKISDEEKEFELSFPTSSEKLN